MMLLPAGVAMNDLLALAEEMDPGGSPEEGKKGRRDKRMLTANSTMQLAAYLAGKVSPGIIFPVRTGHVPFQQQCPFHVLSRDERDATQCCSRMTCMRPFALQCWLCKSMVKRNNDIC